MPTRSTGGVTTPGEKYVFHYLPGIPVLIGLCIISGYDDIETISSAIGKLPLVSNESLLGVTFFLILLIMVLFTVFLLAMMVDAVRHMFEYAFLTPLWTEYWIARNIQNDNLNYRKNTTPEDLERKFNIITKSHETEYFYTEFFGNVAFSLFFLWGVLYWHGNTYLPGFYILWMHIVFILRAVSAQFIWHVQKWSDLENTGRRIMAEHIENLSENLTLLCKNLCFRIMDFWATYFSILVLLFMYCLSFPASLQAFHYYFIMTLIITSSFEVYLVRFKRFEETLKGGILPPFDP